MSIEVIPVGFESLGVRSMCTYVKTPDIKLLIDAGVALGPRFGKFPHPQEYGARRSCRTRIRDFASESDIIIVSHYHNDHHTPNYKESVWLGSSREESEQIYQNKVVIVKDARNSINFSQRKRGWMFQRFLKTLGTKIEIGDNRLFEYGNTKLKISAPVPHGEETSGLGWVVMTTVESGEEKVMHTSDVQGPMSVETKKIILNEKPKLLILGGPPLYLANSKVANHLIQTAITNAAEIATQVPVIIFEHHLLRSEDWLEKVKPVYVAASSGRNKVMTAAEYARGEPLLLESIRSRLYIEDPPSEVFLKWSELPREKQRLTDPPI